MPRFRVPRHFVVKLLLGTTLILAALIVAAACSSETPEIVATDEPVVSPTPQSEATAESESTPTEEPSPTATPIATATSEPTATPRPTATPVPTPTPLPTPTPVPTPTPIPNSPPVIVNPGDKSYHQGESITAFDITVTDAEDTPTVTVSGLPSGLSYGSGQISGTIASDATVKDYTVTISADDGINPTTSATFTIVIAENTAPVIISPGDKSYYQGETIVAFKITVTDVEDTPTVTLSGLPPGLSFESGQVSGTVAFDATVREYAVTISAEDGFNPATSTAFTIVVAKNTAPIIVNPGDKSYEQGESIVAFDVAVTDAEEMPVVSLSGLPPGLSYKSGQVNDTVAVDATAKEYDVTISTDDGFNAPIFANFTITVTQDPIKEAVLRERALTVGNAYTNHDWATIHSFFPDDLIAKCPLSEFIEYESIANKIRDVTIPQGSTFVLESVVIKGDYGWVNSHYMKDGEQIFTDTDQSSEDEPAEWIWKENTWIPTIDPEWLAREKPCSLLGSLQCDDEEFLDLIVQLSEERESSSSPYILKLYSDSIEETGRTVTRLDCKAEARFSRGGNSYALYHYEIDRDGDWFYGYSIGDPVPPREN